MKIFLLIIFIVSVYSLSQPDETCLESIYVIKDTGTYLLKYKIIHMEKEINELLNVINERDKNIRELARNFKISYGKTEFIKHDGSLQCMQNGKWLITHKCVSDIGLHNLLGYASSLEVNLDKKIEIIEKYEEQLREKDYKINDLKETLNNRRYEINRLQLILVCSCVILTIFIFIIGFYKVKGKEEYNISDDNRCKICYENPKNTLLLPCNHFVVCDKCNDFNSCPICRKEIDKFVKIYSA